jgi:hypothetical protein
MPRGVFATVRAWRAEDQHTGIAKDRGVPYTYQHQVTQDFPAPKAEVYRVETFIPFGEPTPIHRNVHYVPGERVDAFFDAWDQHWETVIDIRPLTVAEALSEMQAFREAASKEKS